MTILLIILNVITALLLLAVLLLSRRKISIFERMVKTGQAQKLFTVRVHELTTLLTTMQYYTDMLLKQEFGKLRLSQMELIHKVQESINQGASLCSKLHDPFTYTSMKKAKKVKRDT